MDQTQRCNQSVRHIYLRMECHYIIFTMQISVPHVSGCSKNKEDYSILSYLTLSSSETDYSDMQIIDFYDIHRRSFTYIFICRHNSF